MWSPRLRAVIDILRQHEAAGAIEVDDIEVAAEHFLAMVQALPQRLADFGVFRSKKEEQRRIRQAVKLFVRGISRQP
jgi:TetR/AcrR family transcriptional regulator, mexJK operon transcriptional repressor